LGFFKRVLSGLVIGVGAILPGGSGGILAVAMGLYEKMLDAVSHFFRAPKKNMLFLMPLALGLALGAFIAGSVLRWFIMSWRTQVLFLLIGFVLGGIPSVFHEANKKGFKVRYLIALAVGAGLLTIFWYFESKAPAVSSTAGLHFTNALLVGAILSLGTVVPGVSTSFILMYMGLYEPFLNALATVDLAVLIPLGISFGLVSLILIKVIGFLFERFHGAAYYTVIGFTLASAVLILPLKGFAGWNAFFNMVLLVFGFFGSWFMSMGLSQHAQK